MSLFDDPLPPSCHLKSPFGEPPPPLHVGDVLCEWPHIGPQSLFLFEKKLVKIICIFHDLQKAQKVS